MKIVRTAPLAVLLAVVGLLGWVPAAANQVRTPPGRYVALGDSYSSGEGVLPYFADSDSPGNGCHRSVAAYANVVAGAGGMSLDFWACSGADITDLTTTDVGADGPPWNDPASGTSPDRPASYLDRLGPDVGLVTLTIGGNDVGFGSVMFECVQPWFLGDCRDLEDRTRADLESLDDGRLADLYRTIRERAPSARVLVLGYPRLFPTEPDRFCWLGAGFISPSERRWLNDKARELNDVIERNVAGVEGVEFVDVEDAFEQGALCSGSSTRYLIGVDLFSPSHSFHPTAAGHLVLADAVLTTLASSPETAAPSPVVEPPAPEPAREVATGIFDPATAVWSIDGLPPFRFGSPGDIPLLGDWDCDGRDSVGTWRPSEGIVRIRSENTAGIPDRIFAFGQAGDVPLAGDWTGDGCDTVAVYRPSEGRVFVRQDLGSGPPDIVYYFGIPGDRPFAGDFDGDGIDTVGLYRESTGFVYFRNSHSTGVADNEFFYGIPSDRIVAADWDGDGDDTVAVFRPSERRFYISNTNEQTVAERVIDVGADGLPVAGVVG